MHARVYIGVNNCVTDNCECVCVAPKKQKSATTSSAGGDGKERSQPKITTGTKATASNHNLHPAQTVMLDPQSSGLKRGPVQLLPRDHAALQSTTSLSDQQAAELKAQEQQKQAQIAVAQLAMAWQLAQTWAAQAAAQASAIERGE